MTTQIIPTDRHGRVYYGPTTYAEAEDDIYFAEEEEAEKITTGGTDREISPAAEVADKMERAGYVAVARRIRREYHLAQAAAN